MRLFLVCVLLQICAAGIGTLHAQDPDSGPPPIASAPGGSGSGGSGAIPPCIEEGTESGDEGGICIFDHGCAATEINLNGMCMDRDFLDFLCGGLLDCAPSGGGTGGGQTPPGGGRGNPPQTPTKEQCRAAFNECQDFAAKEGRERCMADQARISAQIVSGGGTCIGDPSEIWDGLFINANDDGPPFILPCDPADLDFSRTDDRAGRCRGAFYWKALSQCARGRRGSTETAGLQATLPFTSIGGSVSVSFQTPAGAGYRALCSAAAIKVATETCTAERTTCEAEAEGVTPVQLPVAAAPIEQFLARIDRKLLGLPAAGVHPQAAANNPATRFRPVQRQPLEIDLVRAERLKFLGDWSEFLVGGKVRPEQQLRIERAMQQAQRGVSNAEDDLSTLELMTWVKDPATGKIGSPEASAEFIRFVQSDAFRSRASAAEDKLLQEVEATIGEAGLRGFQDDVWPGMLLFWLARPMKEIDTIAP